MAALCLALLASLAPLVFVPDFLANRAFFVSYLLLFAVGMSMGMGVRAHLFPSFWLIKRAVAVIRVASVFIAMSAILFVSRQTVPAYGVRRALETRNEVLTLEAAKPTRRSDALEVESVNKKRPMLLHFNDIGTDPKGWINQCVAKYYGLDPVGIRLRPEE